MDGWDRRGFGRIEGTVGAVVAGFWGGVDGSVGGGFEEFVSHRGGPEDDVGGRWERFWRGEGRERWLDRMCMLWVPSHTKGS